MTATVWQAGDTLPQHRDGFLGQRASPTAYHDLVELHDDHEDDYFCRTRSLCGALSEAAWGRITQLGAGDDEVRLPWLHGVEA